MLPIDAWMAFAIVAVGALVQGAVGFGSSLIAAPLLVLIDPVYVPGPMIVAAFVLTTLVAFREKRDLSLRVVGWAVAGRVPGTLLGLGALLVLGARAMGIVFGTLVLLAVAMVTLGKAPPRNAGTLFGAGLVAGLMGTVSSIGGPPMALMFHDAKGPELRGTLSGFFFISTLMSLAGLALVGLFGRQELLAAATLLPGVVVGFALSHRARFILDRGHTRKAVLALATLAALMVIAKQL